MFVLQIRSSDGHLEVNIDPLLIEVLSEIHYLSRPPLSVRLPVSLRQLVKAIDFKQLKHRKTSLEVSLHHMYMYMCTPFHLCTYTMNHKKLPAYTYNVWL